MLSLSLCSLLLSRYMQAVPDSFAQLTDDSSYLKQIYSSVRSGLYSNGLCNLFIGTDSDHFQSIARDISMAPVSLKKL